jgi:hypothetical protein
MYVYVESEVYTALWQFYWGTKLCQLEYISDVSMSPLSLFSELKYHREAKMQWTEENRKIVYETFEAKKVNKRDCLVYN